MPKSAPLYNLLDRIVALGGYAEVHRFLRELHDGLAAVNKAKRSVGRARGGGQSSKAKGRAGVQEVRDLLLRQLDGLQPGDIWIKATSQLGADLHLSPAAVRQFPAHIEVKFVEALNIWGALAQAEQGAAREKLGRFPVVFFKRSRTRLYVALLADDFLGRFAFDVAEGRAKDAPPVGPKGV